MPSKTLFLQKKAACEMFMKQTPISQFQQQFMSIFFANIISSKNLKKTVIRYKLHKHFRMKKLSFCDDILAQKNS